MRAGVRAGAIGLALGLVALVLGAGGEQDGPGPLAARRVRVDLRPRWCTQAPILTRGEALILEVEVLDPAGVELDRQVLAGNALLSGQAGPVRTVAGGRVHVAGGTVIRRRLQVPRAWFKLPADRTPLDLPRAVVQWRSPSLVSARVSLLWLDEDLLTARVRLETSLGAMDFAFEPEQAPDHVKNFLRLSRCGFYDGTRFYRVIRNFLVQAGCANTRDDDPTNDGQGNAPWQVVSEFSTLPHVQGVLSMARNPMDPDSASSHFFIMVSPHEQVQFNGKYTVFGRLMAGDETLSKIAAVETTGPKRTRPKRPVTIKRATVIYPE